MFLKPYKPTVANTTKGVKVSWSKTVGATSYDVYRKTETGKWTKLATVSGTATLSYVDTSAASGNTYYYTVKPKSTVSNGTYISSAAIKCSK